MRFLKHLVKINDIFFISEEIKKINPNFDIFYNKNLNHFEVHDTSRQNSFVISFNNYPNQNLLWKLLKSSSKKTTEILSEIEINNNKILENKRQKIMNKANDCLNEIFKFQEKQTSEISNTHIKNIIEKG